MDLLLEQLDFEYSPTGKYIKINKKHKIREGGQLTIETTEGEVVYNYDNLVTYLLKEPKNAEGEECPPQDQSS